MTALLLISGLLCEICYLAYADVVPLFTDVRGYGVHWPQIVSGRMGGVAFLLASGLHAWTWWKVRRGPESPGARRVALGWIAVFAVTFALQPGILSNDLHTYVLLGRMEAVYHVSPYEVPPVQMRHDPFQPAATAVGVRYTSRYGPAFQAWCAGLVRLSGSNVDAEFMAFRLAALLAALLLISLADRLG
ncbi:MAG: hypothetical protein ACYCW6_22695, partial [Candidatus Xenobia bacterium]